MLSLPISIVIANIISLSVLLFFIQRRWQSNRSIIEPGIVFSINLIILYPIRSFTLLIYGDEAIPNFPEVIIEENLNFSSWLSIIGCISFVIGYFIVIGRHKFMILSGKTRPINFHDDMLICFVFFIVSLVGIAYKIATGDYISYLMSDRRIEGLTQIGTLFAGLQWPAFIGVWVLWFNGLRKPMFLAFFVCVQFVVIPYQFIQGSKTFLSLLMLSILISYYWCRGKFPKITAIGAVALIILFVFPFVHEFRESINKQYGKIPEFSVLYSERIAHNDKVNDNLSKSIHDFSSRYGGIDQLYNMTNTVPDLIPYQFGIRYLQVIINLVPRLIWPSKPTFSHGAEYGSILGTVTSITPFPFGEAYWDMDIPGLIIMMIVWGACLAGLLRIYSYFHNKRGLSFFIGVYFLSQIYWISGGETSMPAVVATIPQQFVLLWLIYLFVKILRPRVL